MWQCRHKHVTDPLTTTTHRRTVIPFNYAGSCHIGELNAASLLSCYDCRFATAHCGHVPFHSNLPPASSLLCSSRLFPALSDRRMRRSSPVTSRDVSVLIPTLPNIPLFTHLPAALLPSFLSYFHILSLPSEATLFPAPPSASATPTAASAAVCPTFYLVLSGSIGAFRSSPLGPSSLLQVLSAGDSFGLDSLLHSSTNPLLYAAVDDSRLLCLTRNRYDSFLASQRCNSALQSAAAKKCIAALQVEVGERTAADLQLLSGLLVSSAKLFHSFDAPLLNKAATHLQLCYAATGDVIQQAGQESDHIYIVLTGGCSVHATATAAQPTHQTTEDKAELMSRREEKLAALVDEQGEITMPVCAVNFHRKATAVDGSEAQPLGECVALLLPTQATPFNDSLLAPSFCSRQLHTVVATQPATLACLSSALLCYLLTSFHRTTSTSALTLPALSPHLNSPPHTRPDNALSQLDTLLKSLPFFQFTQSRVRRLLCQSLRYARVSGSRVLYAQGESAEVYWIVLSGSVSLHTREGGGVGVTSGGSSGDAMSRVRNVSGLEGLVDMFGACTSVARPFTSFNETALVSSTSARPTSHSAITRTTCDLLYLTRTDYLAVCEPSSDLSTHSDTIIRYMRRKHTKAAGIDTDTTLPPTTNTSADEEDRLWSALLHFQWFADLRADLRAVVLASLEVEEVEGEVKMFEEGEETDEHSCMYIIVTGCVGVHLADQKQRAKREREQERKAAVSITTALGGTGSQLGSYRSSPPNRPTTSPSVTTTLFPPLSPTSSATPTMPTSRSGRQIVSHLSPSDLTALYGPSVTVLPTGSHFGDTALTSSSSSFVRRSATIITVEPCYLLKLSRDVVVKVKYLSESVGGSGLGGGAKLMSQSAISSFLSSAPLFSGVLSSLSTVKRLAFHAESRHYKQGDVLCTQGEKADCVMLIVDGEGVVSRHYTVTTEPHANNGSANGKPTSNPATHQRPTTSAQPTHQPTGQLLHSTTYLASSDELPSSLSPLAFSVPLVSLAGSSAIGVWECMMGSSCPYSVTLRVSSASCHVLVIKRAHFMLFYGGVGKGVQRAEEERDERERWWAEVLRAEVDKRVREKRGPVANKLQGKSTAKARGGVAGEMGSVLSVSAVSRQLQSMDISTYAAHLHIARLQHLAHAATTPTPTSSAPSALLTATSMADDKESLIQGQMTSISKRGAVHDKSCAQKMRQTLQQVENRVAGNEKRMGKKSERLAWLRAKRREVLESGTEVDAEARGARRDGSAEDDKDEWLAARVKNTQQWNRQVTEEREAEVRDTDEVWKALLQRREEGAPLSPRSFHSFHSSLFQPTSAQQPTAHMPPHIQPLMHAPSSIHVLTRAVIPTTPSIPHTTATHEDLIDSSPPRLPHTKPTPALPPTKSPRFRPLKAKPVAAEQPGSKAGEESKQWDEEEQRRVVSSLPLSYHSQSVKSWQEEKKLEYEHKVKQIKRRQLREKQHDKTSRHSAPYDEEEEEEGEVQQLDVDEDGAYEPVVQVWKGGEQGNMRVVRLESANAVPSTNELLLRLEKCQQMDGVE